MNPNNTGGGRGRGLLGPGPLMTSHLEITNLDRELNVLRRKREMIRREQQLFSMTYDIDRKRQYEQANRNVPNMYNRAWQPPPKRGNGPHQTKHWMATPRGYTSNMPKPSNYIPALLPHQVQTSRRSFMSSSSSAKPVNSYAGQGNVRTYKTALRARNNSGVSSQSINIMKKNPQDAPNRLRSYTIRKRRDLATKTLDKPIIMDGVKTICKVVEKADPMILREGATLSRRMSGRLELALGRLVKDFKDNCKDDEQFLRLIAKPCYLRIMKQAIRDRIRIAMLNDVVGPVPVIVAKYRAKFPKETDRDIVDLVTNHAIHKPDSIIVTEHPRVYFRRKIDFILDRKIKEMATNLLKMYADGKALQDTSIENVELGEPEEKQSISNDEEAMNVIKTMTGKYLVMQERDILYKFYTELIEQTLEKKFPTYLLKCKEQFLAIFDLDKRITEIENIAKKMAMATTAKEVIELDDAVGEETLVKVETSEKVKIIDEAEIEAKENNEIVIEGTIENTLETNDTEKETVSANNTVPEIVTIPESPEEARDDAMETDNTEEIRPATPKSIKASPKADTSGPNKTELSPATTAPKTPVPNKTQVSSENIKPDTPMPKKTVLSCTTPKTPIQPGTPSAKELPYFVKLIGRPKLPARPVICEFMNNYKPASIKKHKSINNLLVVGFNNEDDYNRILKANETIVGDITIIIKGNEKVNTGKENVSVKESNDFQKEDGKEIKSISPNVTQNPATDEIKNEKDAPGQITAPTQNLEEPKDLIGQELDHITNILTTIKEADEEPDENTNEKPLETNDDKSQESSDSGKVSQATVKEEEAKEKDEEKKDSVEDEGAKIKEGEVEVKNGDKTDSDKVNGVKANVKDVATPVRSSSRLANVTPSTIRTRRTSRLMQE